MFVDFSDGQSEWFEEIFHGSFDLHFYNNYQNYLQNRNRPTDLENKLIPGGKGGIDREIEIDIYTLLYLKQITNKDLLYTTENTTKYSVIT